MHATKPAVSRFLAIFLVIALSSAACAHTQAGRRRQKIAVASTLAGVAIVVGLAILAGAATTCEDTGECPTPRGRAVRPPPENNTTTSLQLQERERQYP